MLRDGSCYYYSGDVILSPRRWGTWRTLWALKCNTDATGNYCLEYVQGMGSSTSREESWGKPSILDNMLFSLPFDFFGHQIPFHFLPGFLCWGHAKQLQGESTLIKWSRIWGKVLVIQVWVGLDLALVLPGSWWPVGNSDHWMALGEAQGWASWHKLPWLTFFLTSKLRTHRAIVW